MRHRSTFTCPSSDVLQLLECGVTSSSTIAAIAGHVVLDKLEFRNVTDILADHRSASRGQTVDRKAEATDGEDEVEGARRVRAQQRHRLRAALRNGDCGWAALSG